MAEITLECNTCRKKKGFKNMEQVTKRGWVIEHQKHGWDIAYCPECTKNNSQDKGT